MSTWLEAFHIIVEQIIRTLGYPGITLLMMIENIFPPLPSEAVLPFAGFMVATGQLSMPGVLLAGSLGTMAGTLLLYWAGYRLPREAVQAWLRRRGKWLLLTERDLDRVIQFFDRHGRMAVLFGRLLPGIRSLISLPAGLDCMPFGVFFTHTLLGTLLWNTLLILAGIALERNWQDVLKFVDRYERILLAALLAWILTVVVRRVREVRAGHQAG